MADTKARITLPARKLQEAVATAVPQGFQRTWRKKSWPICLVLDQGRGVFRIYEARHELAGYELPLAGDWPKMVQLDGRSFRHAIESYPPNELLELVAHADRVEIRNGRSSFSMSRLDAPERQAIETTPIPRDTRHKGPIKVEQERLQNRVELNDTWDFSARMPVPHHRFPESRIPPGQDGPLEATPPAGRRGEVPSEHENERTFDKDLFIDRVARCMEQLLVDDEARDWRKVANYLSLHALEHGINFSSSPDTPRQWALNFLSTMAFHVDFRTLAEAGDGYAAYLESEETAEGLFWWLMSPLHISDY